MRSSNSCSTQAPKPSSRRARIDGERSHGRHRYQVRYLIENLFARLKQFHHLAARYDKLDNHFATFAVLASICIGMA